MSIRKFRYVKPSAKNIVTSLYFRMDLFDVSTISSRLPYGFLILEGPSASRYVTIMRISMASRMMREGADSATKFYVTSSLYAMLASPGSIR
jgi:hypothetical protein